MQLKQGVHHMRLCLKMLCAGLSLAGMTLPQSALAKQVALQPVDQVDVVKYLGTWYEVTRKPMYWQNVCSSNVSATYTLNEYGHLNVENRCKDKDDHIKQASGEAFIENPPANSKLKVSFLPELIRWLPIGRGDYWILKLDPAYQTVLVGEPSRKYLWLLSRTPQIQDSVLNEYLDYAKQQGYDLSDLIRTVQK